MVMAVHPKHQDIIISIKARILTALADAFQSRYEGLEMKGALSDPLYRSTAGLRRSLSVRPSKSSGAPGRSGRTSIATARSGSGPGLTSATNQAANRKGHNALYALPGAHQKRELPSGLFISAPVPVVFRVCSAQSSA